MEAISNLSTTDLMMIGSVVMFGVAIFLLGRMLYPQAFLRDLRERAADARDVSQLPPVRGGAAPVRPSPLRAFGIAFVAKIGSYNDALVWPKWRTRMERHFLTMGKPEYLPRDFRAQQEIYAAFFGLLGVLALNLLRQPIWYGIPFFVLGWFFPYLWLRDQISRRHKAIARALPYHIDLLTLSVEAGLDFGGALQTVVDKGQPGPLIEELSIMLNEIKLGKTREEALRNLSYRIQLLQVSTFVSNLVQADKMGTSMGKVLRIQSTQIRVARAQRAETLANQAPVKMLLPLVACFFPTLFFILFGPIIFRMMGG